MLIGALVVRVAETYFDKAQIDTGASGFFEGGLHVLFIHGTRAQPQGPLAHKFNNLTFMEDEACILTVNVETYLHSFARSAL